MKCDKTLLSLFITICLCLTLGDFLPDTWQSALYACSLSIKASLVWFLPFFIFGYISRSIGSLASASIRIIIGLIALIFVSNLVAALLGYTSLYLSPSQIKPIDDNTLHLLSPAWTWTLTNPIKNEWALIGGFSAGILLQNYSLPMLEKLTQALKKIADVFLQKLFMPVLPLFIAGYIIKLQYDKQLYTVLSNNVSFLSTMLCYHGVYLLFMIYALSKGRWRVGINYIRALFPAIVTGFSSMSSLAALPLSLDAAKKNTNNHPLAKTVPTALVNTHLIGDSIGIPILALALVQSYGLSIPSFMDYCHFALLFALAKFSVAAIPGGGILVMLAILEEHLHFTSCMTGTITTTYILLDPLFTAINVLWNGVFTILYTRFFPMQESLLNADKRL